MTIAVGLRVGDGVVLGSDSASTLWGPDGVLNIYFNAEKISNLVKGLPLGMVTYGLGGMKGRSTTYLTKDLRRRFMKGGDPLHFDPENYTVGEVAARVRTFFYNEHYVEEFGGSTEGGDAPDEDEPLRPAMGFLVAGYSANSHHPEIWAVEIDARGACPDPVKLMDNDVPTGELVWRGVDDAMNRLVLGLTEGAFQRLTEAGVTPEAAVEVLRAPAYLAASAMPIQDAVDLVRYLIEVTCGFVRFSPGHPTVAPPIDLASITGHEGFKWISRKHYYPSALNPAPEEP